MSDPSNTAEQAKDQAANDKKGSKTPPPPPPPPPPSYKIVNGTARRVGIRPKSEESPRSPLVISPFGLREIDAKELENYNLEPWKSLNLVKCEELKTEPVSEWIFGAVGCLGLVVFICALGWLFSQPTRESFLFQAATVVLVGVVIFAVIAFSRRMTAIVSTLVKTLVIMAILVVGVSCPLMAAGYFAMESQMEWLGKSYVTEANFGRALQIIFVIIASTLPGLLYFIFERQKQDMVRVSLHQQILLLDPNIATTFDVEQRYSPLIDAVYGAKGAAYYLGTGGWSLIISTILLTLGWITVLFPIVPRQDMVLGNLAELFAPSPSVWTFGFLGAYFFALNMVFKRYVRSDLTAKAYTHISVRILITAALAWVLSVIQLASLGSAENPVRLFSAFAFLVGIVPETGTTFLQEWLRRVVGVTSQSIAEKHPLTNLEGVNIYDRGRLSEEGVDNIENAAHHNLIELLIRTRIPAQRLVDIVDQAILYLHAGDDGMREIGDARVKENEDDSSNKNEMQTSGQNVQPSKEARKSERELTLQLLRSYGIRTATDLERACGVAGDYDDVTGEGSVKDGILFKSLNDEQRKQYENRLRVILHALGDDEWMPQLRHWRKETARIETMYVEDPEEFFVGSEYNRRQL